MPIPNAASAVVSKEKTARYLLDLAHPTGKSKAAWFVSLGYHPDDPDQLASDLIRLVHEQAEYTLQSSPFGVKYVVRGEIKTPSGRIVSVTTVWAAKSRDDRPWLVTAYPGKGVEP